MRVIWNNSCRSEMRRRIQDIGYSLYFPVFLRMNGFTIPDRSSSLRLFLWLSRYDFEGDGFSGFVHFRIHCFYFGGMNSDRDVFLLVDRDALFQVCRQDFRELTVYIEIHITDFILSGRECEPQIEELVSVDLCGSAFFQGTLNGNTGRSIALVFKSHFYGVYSGIPVLVDGSEGKGVISSETFVEIHCRHFIDASGVCFRNREFLDELSVIQHFQAFNGIVRNVPDLKRVLRKRIASSVLE